jgi:hypothetical protein
MSVVMWLITEHVLTEATGITVPTVILAVAVVMADMAVAVVAAVVAAVAMTATTAVVKGKFFLFFWTFVLIFANLFVIMYLYETILTIYVFFCKIINIYFRISTSVFKEC